MNKIRKILALIVLSFIGWGLSACKEGLPFDPERAVYSNFSGERALSYVDKQTSFGPRVAGSDSLEETRQYMEQLLLGWGWEVKRQVFQQKTPEGQVEFVNLRVRYAGKRGDAAQQWARPIDGVIVSHYESKKFTAFDFVGANDPGSSVGGLLEIARVLSERPEIAEKVELVFFDGEEAFVEYSDIDGLYGSRHYAKLLKQWPDKTKPLWGLLLDMIGDKDLAIRVPKDSPSHLAEALFAAAEDLSLRKHFGMGGQKITDDHVPLNEVGIPTIDIIDMDYSYWHTPGDTADKLSAESLEIVGETVLLMIEKYLLDKSEH